MLLSIYRTDKIYTQRFDRLSSLSYTQSTSSARPLHAYFEMSVARNPNALALDIPPSPSVPNTPRVLLTYQELKQRTDQLARSIMNLPNHIKNLDLRIGLIFRNYSSKTDEKLIIKIRDYCRINKRKFFLSNNTKS